MGKKIFLGGLILLVGIIVGITVKVMINREKLVLPSFAPLHKIEELEINESSPSGILSMAHNSFGIDVLQKLYKENNKNNIFISPLSLALDLSMLYNGADGATRDAMTRTLKFDNLTLDQINKNSFELVKFLENPEEKVQISIANSIWARDGEKFNNDFLNVNKNYYKARVESVNFDHIRTVEAINRWVSENTRGKISEIIQPPIPPGAVMYLINAIYFNGSWTIEFDEKLTEEKDFQVLGGSKKKVPMMVRNDKLLYLENDIFQSVILPYGESKKIEMEIFLPKKGIDNFLGQLNIKNWNKWMSRYKEEDGTLVLPKFKIESEKKLNEVLSSMGMGVAFGSGANFNRMKANPSGPELFISDVLHKTYIDVGEEGTEAAAITSIKMVGTAAGSNSPEPFYMEVNKPFFFTIRDTQTAEILFTGIVQNPNEI